MRERDKLKTFTKIIIARQILEKIDFFLTILQKKNDNGCCLTELLVLFDCERRIDARKGWTKENVSNFMHGIN